MNLPGEAPTPAEAAKLEQVVRWLTRRQAHMATAILRLGRIRFCDRVETAGVRVTGTEVELFFNREFFASLKLVELTAVLLHESLHVAFCHQARAERIASHWDRRLFTHACEAVVNDVIARHFPQVVLPANHVTGKLLIGRDASDLSAERVMQLLQAQSTTPEDLAKASCIDDHDVWDPEVGEATDPGKAPAGGIFAPRWSDSSSQLAVKLLGENLRRLLAMGETAGGQARRAPRKRCRTDLRQFLLDQLCPAHRYAATWSHPNRKAMALYPSVILPSDEPGEVRLRVLMAIDTSGSVSTPFLGEARAVANQHLPGTRIRLVTFDTAVYDLAPGAVALMGGGGTDAGCVERFIHQKLRHYPDQVFLFTDGLTAPFSVLHPERWIWLLPPEGSAQSVPQGSRAYHFDFGAGKQARPGPLRVPFVNSAT